MTPRLTRSVLHRHRCLSALPSSSSSLTDTQRAVMGGSTVRALSDLIGAGVLTSDTCRATQPQRTMQAVLQV